MGNCYYIKRFKGEKYDSGPEIVKIPSEAVGTAHPVAKITNTTFGIWFYERDLLYRTEELKKDLHALVEMIDAIAKTEG